MSYPSGDKLIEILLIEDNPGDVDLAKVALRTSQIPNRLHGVADGEAALAFLSHEEPYTDVPRPDLILLDLNLPLMDGREVLQRIKSDPKFQAIPVIIFTSSASEVDIRQTYQLHANCYLTKPLKLEDFLEMIQSIEAFWLTRVQLPPKGN
ncbi:response regulator [Coleofasciculus sp.]|uniref:response regulator n=1 Tax=Coleofasciculus sp. TaxID=3100458 RepID=UPI003A306D69